MMTKINIGCGGRPLVDYINIDQDSLNDIRLRYPNKVFEDSIVIENHNIFNLPYSDNSIDEVRADGLLEHLSFKDEPRLLYEIKRILKKDGIFEFSVPDFEEVCRIWLSLEDDWKDFFSDSEEDIKNSHWFGTYTYEYKNRWGYIIATIYGSQNGEGQYHRNCYSKKKIQKMMAFLGFNIIKLESFLWKSDRDPMIRCVVEKA